MNLGLHHYREISWTRRFKSDAEQQLENFLKEMHLIKSNLNKSQARIFRVKYIKMNFEEIYRDNITLFTEHMSVPIEKFMSDVCSYRKKLHDSKHKINHNPFREGNMIYGIPMKKCNARKLKFV